MICALAIMLPVILWSVFLGALPCCRFEFDFDNVHGTFMSILPYYRRFYWIVGALGLLGAMETCHIGIDWAALLLLLAAVNALLFNGVILVLYESYMHSRYTREGLNGVSNYTAPKYALVLALGVSAVVLLLAGAAVAACQVA